MERGKFVHIISSSFTTERLCSVTNIVEKLANRKIWRKGARPVPYVVALEIFSSLLVVVSL